MVQWLSLLHNFVQQSLNSGYAQVQNLLTACQRNNGPMVQAGNKAKRFSFVNHATKTTHHHQLIIPSMMKTKLKGVGSTGKATFPNAFLTVALLVFLRVQMQLKAVGQGPVDEIVLFTYLVCASVMSMS